MKAGMVRRQTNVEVMKLIITSSSNMPTIPALDREWGKKESTVVIISFST